MIETEEKIPKNVIARASSMCAMEHGNEIQMLFKHC